jgi:hypothetical protein
MVRGWAWNGGCWCLAYVERKYFMINSDKIQQVIHEIMAYQLAELLDMLREENRHWRGPETFCENSIVM